MPPAPQRVVILVLGDHLDRTERLLVELKHADADDSEMIPPLRAVGDGMNGARIVSANVTPYPSKRVFLPMRLTRMRAMRSPSPVRS